jgi:hypothetical protein
MLYHHNEVDSNQHVADKSIFYIFITNYNIYNIINENVISDVNIYFPGFDFLYFI